MSSTDIHEAARNGDLENVRVLLQNDPNLVSSKDHSGWTPLHWAVSQRRTEVVKRLIQGGANPNIREPSGMTPLHFAAQTNSGENAEMLLAAGADPHIRDNRLGETPMEWAMSLGAQDFIAILKIRNISAPPSLPLEAIAAVKADDINTLEKMLSNHLDINARNDSLSLLHYAAKDGRLQMVRRLLETGASVNAINKNGMTPLWVASAMGHAHIAELLLNSGADPDVAAEGPYPKAIDVAHFRQHTSVVSILSGYRKNIQ